MPSKPEYPKIEAGIPIPARRRPGPRGFNETLRLMQVGDSISLVGRNPESVRTKAYLITGAKFRVAKGETGAFRVWRIS